MLEFTWLGGCLGGISGIFGLMTEGIIGLVFPFLIRPKILRYNTLSNITIFYFLGFVKLVQARKVESFQVV